MGKSAKTDTVAFSVKGQVVIPQWIRKEFSIEEGTRAVVCPTPEGILLKPITQARIKSLRGLLKNSKAFDVLREERRKERNL